MARAFSLPSEALSYFIGFTLLRSDEIRIVSPWLSNVEIRLPVNDRFDQRNLQLVTILSKLTEKDIQFIIRTGEQHNEYIKNHLPNHIVVHEIDDLHAKAVVSDEFVYMGSANITRNGLTLNRELCEVVENNHESAQAYLQANLGLETNSVNG